MTNEREYLDRLLLDLTECGRIDVIARLGLAVQCAKRLKDDHDAMLENLTATQKRCTELLEELRQYRKEQGD